MFCVHWLHSFKSLREKVLSSLSVLSSIKLKQNKSCCSCLSCFFISRRFSRCFSTQIYTDLHRILLFFLCVLCVQCAFLTQIEQIEQINSHTEYTEYTEYYYFFCVFCVFSVKVPLRGTCSPACCDQAARTFGPLAWSLDKMRTLGNPNKFGFLSLNRIFRTKSGLRPTTASSTQNIIPNTGFCRCPIIFYFFSVFCVFRVLFSRRLLRALRWPFGLPFGREHFVV